MANRLMYETTYASTFARRTPSRIQAHNGERRRSSPYCCESSLFSNPLPPLKPEPQEQISPDASPSQARPTVYRSGFWCENPSEKIENSQAPTMQTTNQAMYVPPPKYDFSNLSNTRKGTTPFTREPFLVASQQGEYQTTNRDAFRKIGPRELTLPGHVVMESTGFQRGAEGSIVIGSKEKVKLSDIEIERMRTKDPVGYLGAKADDNPYISMNKLCYQAPPKIARK